MGRFKSDIKTCLADPRLARFSLMGLLTAALFIMAACAGRPTSTTWDYSQFVQAVEQGQIEAVSVDAGRSQAIAHTKDGEIISVELPSDPNLVGLLDQHDVTITVAPQSTQFDPSGIVFSLTVGIIFLVGFLFWFWMLIDCAMNEPSEGNTKVVWILIILFANGIGALIYFFFRRPQRRRELGQ